MSVGFKITVPPLITVEPSEFPSSAPVFAVLGTKSHSSFPQDVVLDPVYAVPQAGFPGVRAFAAS